MNVGEALSHGRGSLAGASDTPARDASLLLSHVLGRPPEFPYLHPEAPLPEETFRRYLTLIERRTRGEPVAYLRGFHEFMGLTFKVDRRALVPRPETEHVVETVLRLLAGSASPLVVDLCCGSGAIGLSMAKRLTAAAVVLADVSREALDLARENSELLGLSRQVIFLEGDLTGPLLDYGLAGKVDVMAANPPYIAHDEIDSLPVDVRSYEPRLALDGGCAGLEVIARIVDEAPAVLKPGGHLVMEIGAGQGETCLDLLAKSNLWRDTAVLRDYAGRQRMVVGRTRFAG